MSEEKIKVGSTKYKESKVMKNRNELAKKVDKSILMGARFTIPQENLGMFLQGKDILPGKNIQE